MFVLLRNYQIRAAAAVTAREAKRHKLSLTDSCHEHTQSCRTPKVSQL